MDLISRQAAMKKFAEVVAPSNNSDFQKPPTWNDAVEIVEDFPSADVRPVVLCKDCDLWNEWDSSGRESLGTYRCSCAEWTTEITTYYTGPDEFCSRGVRRESDG